MSIVGASIDRGRAHPIAFATVIGLFVRVALLLLYHHGEALSNRLLDPVGDQHEYLGLAENLLAAKGYVLFQHGYAAPGPYVYRPPGYPIFLAAALAVSGHHLGVVRALQTLATVAFVPICMIGLHRLASRPSTVLLGGLIVAVNPFLVYFAIPSLDSDWLFDLLWTGGAVLFLEALSTERRRTAIGAGLLLGSAALVRGEGWFYAWAMMAIAAIIGRGVAVRRCAWVLCGFLPLIVVWSARNWTVFHAFIPTQRGAMARSILESHEASYSHYRWPGYEAWSRDVLERQEKLPEVEREPFIMREVKSYYGAHPRYFLTSCLHKAMLFYAFTPQASYETEGQVVATPYQGSFYRLTSLVGYALFLPFFLFGAWLLTRSKPLLVMPLCGAIAVNAMIGMLANPNIRIRTEMQAILLIVACIGIERALARVARREKAS